MKMWILAMAMMFGVTLSAQGKKERHEPLKPEQRTELQVKKMTLALDLTEKQQQDIKKVLLDRNMKKKESRAQFKAHRESGKKLTADDRFALQSKRLDDRIAMKKEMKRILTPEQFEKLQKTHKERSGKITKRKKNFKKHNRR